MWRVRVTVSGGVEPDGEIVKDALGGVSSILADRLLSKTGRGASTLGFKDYKGEEMCAVCAHVSHNVCISLSLYLSLYILNS